MLMPVKKMRPLVDIERAKKILLDFYGLRAAEVRELDSYDDRNFYVKVYRENGTGKGSTSSRSSSGDESDEYVLKILNSLNLSTVHVDAEHDLRDLLKSNGFSCPVTVKNLSNEFKSIVTIELPGDDGVVHKYVHIVRLLTFIPGQVLGDVKKSTHLFTSVGRYLADMHHVINDFQHPGFDKHVTIWNLENVSCLKNFLTYVTDEKKRKMAQMVIDAFEKNVVPVINRIKRGLIHADFNDRNIIVGKRKDNTDSTEDLYETTGVIDFGDVVVTCLTFDLACAVTYMIIENKGACPDPIDAGGYVIGGYLSRHPISEEELKIMPYCVMARYAQSLVLGAYSYTMDPENGYALYTSVEGWKQLQKLLELGPEEALKKWKRIAKQFT